MEYMPIVYSLLLGMNIATLIAIWFRIGRKSEELSKIFELARHNNELAQYHVKKADRAVEKVEKVAEEARRSIVNGGSGEIPHSV